MKQFFLTLPRNIINCFKGRLIVWHILAIIVSAACVMSGFDWAYFTATQNSTLQTRMFPAVPIGGLLPIALPLALLVGGWVLKNVTLERTGWAIGQVALIKSNPIPTALAPCITLARISAMCFTSGSCAAESCGVGSLRIPL